MAKNIPVRKAKTHTIIMPAMAPGFNDDDDAEKALVSCCKGVPEDIKGNEVDEDEGTDEYEGTIENEGTAEDEGAGIDEDGSIDEDGTEEISDVKEVDIWGIKVLVPVTVTVVVVSNEALARLSG